MCKCKIKRSRKEYDILYKTVLIPEFLNNKSLTKISQEYHVDRGILASKLRKDGYIVINM